MSKEKDIFIIWAAKALNSLWKSVLYLCLVSYFGFMKYIFSICIICLLLWVSSCFKKSESVSSPDATEATNLDSTNSVVQEPEPWEWDATDFVDDIYSTATSLSNMVEIQGFNPSLPISSPLELSGIVPVEWISDWNFPLQIIDSNWDTIAQGFWSAETVDENGEAILWFTQYTANIEFTLPSGVSQWKLIFSSSNVSQEWETDSAEIEVSFQ